MIDCPSPETPLPGGSMKDEPLQIRAKRAGLPQKVLAKILGVTETTASLQLRGKWQSGTPQYVIAVIAMWERLSHDDRMAVRSELGVDDG
jgi:hypothetical protein